ncbi:unnamed protein product [Urochloa decumbens]|uniref:F-box domain-containing protein n=1 Tax=Urochloa decumbens TaxID=240449 RepID=A0ABC9AZW0_9POAL
MEAAESWVSSLPTDLLVAIFRRLDVSDLIRCAGASRLWRRAIIGNASHLRPRPDCFLPDLFLGFFHTKGKAWLLLERVQGRFVPQHTFSFYQQPPPAPAAGDDRRRRVVRVPPRHNKPLSSRDGFLLHGGSAADGELCLSNPLTGGCRLLPAAALEEECLYALVTGHDVVSSDGMEEVWILALNQWKDEVKGGGGMRYQVFSSESGEWGPVKCSPNLEVEEGMTMEKMYGGEPTQLVVCRGGAVYCLVVFKSRGPYDLRRNRCVFAVDVRTERTWTTELPPERSCRLDQARSDLVLATSEDGGLALVVLPTRCGQEMEAWVLGGGGGGGWTLRRRIDVGNLLPGYPNLGRERQWLVRICGFCPRSGCLFGDVGFDGEYFLVVGVDGGSPCLIKKIIRGDLY